MKYDMRQEILRVEVKAEQNLGGVATESLVSHEQGLAGNACGVCKFHWGMTVMPGQKHNVNCPHSLDAVLGCVCQGCSQRFKVDIQVDDALWNQIRPHDKPEGAGLLCGVCIFRRIEALGQFNAFTLATVSVPAQEMETQKLG